MIIALIDNGSLEPAALANLRAVAAALSERAAAEVYAVSWKHSDRISAHSLTLAVTETASDLSTKSEAASVSEWTGRPWTLAPFVRAHIARGEREFLFVPFFISAQGAIGSALRHDLERLQAETGGLEFSFTAGLGARGVIPAIVADRIRTTISQHALEHPAAIVVDHGGPSKASATLRDQLANDVRLLLRNEIGSISAASMEGAHPPLLADELRAAAFARGPLVVAPLFLSPGRHAGPRGDIAQICAAANTRCHITELVGTHPLAVGALAAALQESLSPLHVQPSA